MTYSKEIEITATGMVIARVFGVEMRCAGLEFFSSPFSSSNATVEKNARKANEWADERIRICETWEFSDKR